LISKAALAKVKSNLIPVTRASESRFLYIDEVNLLDDHLVDILLDVAASGWNKVERESVSIEHPASFVLIGSGIRRRRTKAAVADRFGLHAEVKTESYLENRVAIVERRGYDQDPASFNRAFENQQRQLRERSQQLGRLWQTSGSIASC
jgi:magnesium chelatase subunit I